MFKKTLLALLVGYLTWVGLAAKSASAMKEFHDFSDELAKWFQIEVKVPVREVVEVERDIEAMNLEEIIREESRKADIPALLTLAIAHVESSTNLNPKATRFEPAIYERQTCKGSDLDCRMRASSHGLMQVMAFNLESCGLGHWSELYHPRKNVACGLKILRNCLARSKAKADLDRYTEALGCYNGDRVRYPNQVKIALANLAIDKLVSKE